MEHGGSSGQRKRCHPRSSSGIPRMDTNKSRNTGKQRSQQCNTHEQDQYVPTANVIRIMRRVLPPHAKITDDAKETIQQCVSEYIGFITSEANDRCRSEQRKTVTAEDILSSMRKLGFDKYIDPLTSYLNRYRQHESERTSVRGEPFVKRTVDYAQAAVPVGSMSDYGVPFMMGHRPLGLGMYNYAGGMNNELYMNLPGGHASSSTTSGVAYAHASASFDPYAQFK